MAADIQIRAVRQAASTAGGNQDFTVSGAGDPKGALFIVTAATSDGVVANDAILSIGATDGTRQWAASNRDRNGVADSEVARVGATDEVIQLILSSSDAIDGEANFNSWVTDGVRITWGSAPSSAYLITCILFYGSDITAFRADTFSLGNTSTVQSYTSMGFLFDAMFLAGHCDVFNDSISAFCNVSLGLAVRSGFDVKQKTMFCRASDAAASASNLQVQSGNHGAAQGSSVSDLISYRVQLWNASATGFDFSTSTSTGNDEIGFIALQVSDDVSCVMLDILSPTSTGEVTYPVLGSPVAALGLITPFSSGIDSPISSDVYAAAVSLVNANEQFCNAIASEDASATMDTQSVSDDKAINLDYDDGSTAIDAALSSFGDGGMVLNWTAVDVSNRCVTTWLVFSDITDIGGGGGEGGAFNPIGLGSPVIRGVN